MLNGVIICPDKELGDALEQALNHSHRFIVLRKLDQYPKDAALGALLRGKPPEVIFLSVESEREVSQFSERVRLHAGDTQFVAVHRSCDPSVLLRTMRAGIREFLHPPFKAGTIHEVLGRLEANRGDSAQAPDRLGPLYVFLPTKMGSGATTIATNVSMALARGQESRPLLIDLDLNAGLVGFMLRLTSQYSVLDAAESSENLDENMWTKMVSTAGNLDVLPTGTYKHDYRIDPGQVRRILEFARRNYRVVAVDLSGMMEKFTIEVLQEARRIYLVCSPELPSLHQARLKLEFLRSLSLEDRISILLNRERQPMDIPRADVENVFGMPIHMTFPNDYQGVHKALMAGKPVSETSALGRRYVELAGEMLPLASQEAEAKRGFRLLPAFQKKYAHS